MSGYLRKYLRTSSELNLNLLDKIRKEYSSEIEHFEDHFVWYLENILTLNNDIVNKAKKIEWAIIFLLFDIEYRKLEEKIFLPKYSKVFIDYKKYFRDELLQSSKPNIYLFIVDIFNELPKDISKDELNKKLGDQFNHLIYHIFRIYDFQHQLTLIGQNKDKKVIITELEEIINKANIGNRFKQGKGFTPEEVKVFDKIIDKIDKAESEGLKVSKRELAYNSAFRDFGHIHSADKENYYQRFLRYSKKKK